MMNDLAGQSVVLVADETADAKSSTDCVGAGRQYSGAIGGVGLCRVAVHLAAVTATTKVIIDRALYLPADWAADEERREVAGVPEGIAFATKPQQALAMVTGVLAAELKARWFAGDGVYRGRELRRGIRVLGIGYTVGIAATYQVIDGTGRCWEARKMINKERPRAVDAPVDRTRHQGPRQHADQRSRWNYSCRVCPLGLPNSTEPCPSGKPKPQVAGVASHAFGDILKT